jgi:hypothetical protein
MYYLNRACEIQLAASQLAILGQVRQVEPALCQHVSQQFQGVEHERQIVWQAWLRKLDRIDPSYKD